jgi:hypothetical protein
MFILIHTPRQSPFVEITGKLYIIVLQSGGSLVKGILYATCRLRRCFLLNGVWLSHSACDASMVKIVVAIVVESAEDDITNEQCGHDESLTIDDALLKFFTKSGNPHSVSGPHFELI